MNRLLLHILVLGIFTLTANGQSPTLPTLMGTWIGGSDYGEWRYGHSACLDSYLRDDPTSRALVRLCTKNGLAEALATSNGAAYQFFDVNAFYLPPDRSYLATYDNCPNRSEQVWFLPSNSRIPVTTEIRADKIETWRGIEDYYSNFGSAAARKEFRDHLIEFLRRINDDPKAQGFVISNIGTRQAWVLDIAKNVARYRADRKRIHYIKKRQYETHFPEFLVISINQ